MATSPRDMYIPAPGDIIVQRGSNALLTVLSVYYDEILDETFLWCRILINKKFLTVLAKDCREAQ